MELILEKMIFYECKFVHPILKKTKSVPYLRHLRCIISIKLKVILFTKVQLCQCDLKLKF